MTAGMQKPLKLLLILAMGLIASFTHAADHVLVVSIDALHPSALTESVAPNLYALMQSGRYTLNGRSVDPPKTLIAHTAMFTGLTPDLNGKRDNEWSPGNPTIAHATLFNDAKIFGYRTAFFYSKPKLGFLVNSAIDVHAMEPLEGTRKSSEFVASAGKVFVLLHISGLEYAGTDSGWLSAEYLAELSDIDRTLAPVVAQIRKQTSFAIIVTSDHGGHDRSHGTDHPDDFKLPLIIYTDDAGVQPISKGIWSITRLRSMVGSLLN